MVIGGGGTNKFQISNLKSQKYGSEYQKTGSAESENYSGTN
jgi:hypothetical protein